MLRTLKFYLRVRYEQLKSFVCLTVLHPEYAMFPVLCHHITDYFALTRYRNDTPYEQYAAMGRKTMAMAKIKKITYSNFTHRMHIWALHPAALIGKNGELVKHLNATSGMHVIIHPAKYTYLDRMLEHCECITF